MEETDSVGFRRSVYLFILQTNTTYQITPCMYALLDYYIYNQLDHSLLRSICFVKI